MAWDPTTDRWPPIYDAEELARTINDLTRSGRLEKEFWLRQADHSFLCQGDLLRLRSGAPVIASDGEPGVAGDYSEWLVLGNTCDLSRPVHEVEWSQVVPVLKLKTSGIPTTRLDALRTYAVVRQFFLPAWDGDADETAYADLTRVVTIHKSTLEGRAHTAIRMSIHGWVMLHACLVRFLARDDGRHAA